MIIKNKKFYNIKTDGITQSLLSMFRACRQKARMYLEGYDTKYHKLGLTYGTIGHALLEEVYTDIMTKKIKGIPAANQIKKHTAIIEKKWYAENKKYDKESAGYVEYSLALLEKTIPLYFDFHQKDLKAIRWLGLERKFALPYKLQDGRETIIRGKIDGDFEKNGMWLFESKFWSVIPEASLSETLSLDGQVLLYLWALKNLKSRTPQGAIYNIIRRTCLNQKKDESLIKFSARVQKDIEERPEFYFIRYEIFTDKIEMKNFANQLHGMVRDFYDWWQGFVPHYKNPDSCNGKYGACQYLTACARNDFSALHKRKVLFSELEDF